MLWSVLLEHIEPLAVLRATVTRWASLHAHDCSSQEAAQNLLLLLDPDLIGDSKHVRAPSAPCPADIAPRWPDLPSQPRRLRGELPPVDLAAPPPYLPLAFYTKWSPLAPCSGLRILARTSLLPSCRLPGRGCTGTDFNPVPWPGNRSGTCSELD